MPILTELKSGDLKRVVKLLEQKEGLQAQIEVINRQLADFEAGQSAPAPIQPSRKKVASKAPAKLKMPAAGRAGISAAAKARGAKVKKAKSKTAASKPAPRASGTPRKQGQLKEQIIGLVRGAGKTGITVKEIAAKVGAKAQSIHVWFHATGKKVEEIKRIRPGTYAWQG